MYEYYILLFDVTLPITIFKKPFIIGINNAKIQNSLVAMVVARQILWMIFFKQAYI